MSELEKLVEVCHWMNVAGYSPATSGNYSLRMDHENFWVSASGIDKGKINSQDFLKMNLKGESVGPRKPSDEALIHAKIYELHPNANCILHGHTVANTIVSMRAKSDLIHFQGFEMQKAFTGIKTHLDTISVDILDNEQDMNLFVQKLKVFDLPAFMIRGHGTYVWGENVLQAKRHLEGLEFLLQCQLEMGQ